MTIVEQVSETIWDVTAVEIEALRIEFVRLPAAGLPAGPQRVRTDSGREIGLDFSGAELKPGDVLLREVDSLVIVALDPTVALG